MTTRGEDGQGSTQQVPYCLQSPLAGVLRLWKWALAALPFSRRNTRDTFLLRPSERGVLHALVSFSRQISFLHAGLAASLIVLSTAKLAHTYYAREVELRYRCVVLKKVREVVQQWESRCFDEVISCGIPASTHNHLSKLVGRDATIIFLRLWHRQSDEARGSAGPTHECGVFHGIVPSFAFAPDFTLSSCMSLLYTAHHVLSLPEDRRWMHRLCAILQYALFRRVAMMEEARLYAFLWRRAVLRPLSCKPTSRVPKPPRSPVILNAWEVYGRPSWLVPHTPLAFGIGGGVCTSFFCLPLSYFPIGSVFASMEESEMGPGVLKELVSLWKKECVHIMQLAKLSALEEGRMDRTLLTQAKISFLFVHYGRPLVERQWSIEIAATKRFFLEKMCYGIAATRGGGLDEELTNPFVIEKLRLHKWVHKYMHRPSNADDDGTHMYGYHVFIRSATKERVFRRLLVLRAGLKLISLLLQLVSPRFMLYDIFFYVSTMKHAVPGVELGSHEVPALLVGRGSSDRVLEQLVTHVLMHTLTNMLQVTLAHFVGIVRGRLVATLEAEIHCELRTQLAGADEAFLQRYVRLESSDGGGGDSGLWLPMSAGFGREGGTAGRVDSSGHPVAKETVRSILRRAETASALLIRAFDVQVAHYGGGLVMLMLALCRRDLRSLLLAYSLSFVDYRSVGEWLSAQLHFSKPHAVRQKLDTLQYESISTCSPWGLRLVVDVLAEVECGEVLQTKGKTLLYPCLSLLACSSVWDHSWLADAVPPGECHSAARKFDTSATCVSEGACCLWRVMRVRHLYQRIVNHAYPACTIGRFLRGGQVDAEYVLELPSFIASLLMDVQCICTLSLEATYRDLLAQCGGAFSSPRPRERAALMGGGPTGKLRAMLHQDLDPEEVAIVLSPAAMHYLPRGVDFFTLFSGASRFILRQLGLELVFTYRALMDLRLSAKYEDVADVFGNATYSPFTSFICECGSALEVFLLIGALCTRWDGMTLLMQRCGSEEVCRRVEHIHAYRRVLRAEESVEVILRGVRQTQQLCHYFPMTISDNSAWSHSPQVRARREALRARRLPDFPLLLDATGRITGGFFLSKGIAFHHVNFSYPQLHHVASGDATSYPHVKPILQDITFDAPATGMLAIIGRTGAGKTSLTRLLRRLYDPLPIIRVVWPGDSSEMEAGQKWSGEILEKLLWIQWIENLLPMPSKTTQYACLISLDAPIPASLALEHHSYISLDGIPAACFSTSYLRQWLPQLEQFPTVLEQLTFAENVAFLSHRVTNEDVACALHQCRCMDFVGRTPLGMDNPVGKRSAGERQRLALARVVANVRARIREEEDVSHCQSEEPEDGYSRKGRTWGCLLLDEPTSRLDSYNELLVYSCLDDLLSPHKRGTSGGSPSIAIITISHRLSSLRAATKMMVLDDGKVAMIGTPSVVLAENTFAKEELILQSLHH